jgi:hypothetical protein
MMKLYFGTIEVEIKNPVPLEDETNYDQSMIVRRTRGGQLCLFRDSSWHDFDTLLIQSKMNIRENAEDAVDLISDSWGQIITMDLLTKRYTGIVITDPHEIITIQDDCSYDLSFDFLVETEDDIP